MKLVHKILMAAFAVVSISGVYMLLAVRTAATMATTASAAGALASYTPSGLPLAFSDAMPTQCFTSENEATRQHLGSNFSGVCKGVESFNGVVLYEVVPQGLDAAGKNYLPNKFCFTRLYNSSCTAPKQWAITSCTQDRKTMPTSITITKNGVHNCKAQGILPASVTSTPAPTTISDTDYDKIDGIVNTALGLGGVNSHPSFDICPTATPMIP